MMRVLLGVWLAASVVQVERTLPRWRDDGTLWTWVERQAPRSWYPATNLARHASRIGDVEGCLRHARRAIELHPTYDPAWNLSGRALMLLGRYEEARTAFERAAAIRPESGLYRNNVAGALIELKRFGEAERILTEEALPRDSEEPAMYSNLGIVYLLTGRPAEAVPPLEQALRLVPANEKRDAAELLRHARTEAARRRSGS
jgi:Flp pilus assembly protein TadD